LQPVHTLPLTPPFTDGRTGNLPAQYVRLSEPTAAAAAARVADFFTSVLVAEVEADDFGASADDRSADGGDRGDDNAGGVGGGDSAGTGAGAGGVGGDSAVVGGGGGQFQRQFPAETHATPATSVQAVWRGFASRAAAERAMLRRVAALASVVLMHAGVLRR
jgi:hypothetical protein